MKKNQIQSSATAHNRRTSPRGSQDKILETADSVHGAGALGERSSKPARRSARLSIQVLTQYPTQAQTATSPSTGIQESQFEPVVNEISQALDSSSARMTSRKRAVSLAIPEDQEEGNNNSPSKHTREGSGGSGSSGNSGNSVAHICLCQPDPKIPRPRNAFILYRQRHQAEILAQHPGLPNPEISKIAGELWKAEPESVKNEWKLLAEEEKARHAQLYPDYRFRPRHKTRRGSGSSSTVTNQPIRCNKCGGRSIVGGGSPFTSPLSSASLPSSNVTSPTPTPGGNGRAGQKRYMPQVANLSLSSPRAGGFGISSSPTANRFQEGMQDPKRRRFSPYPNGMGPRGAVAATRNEESRPSTSGNDHRRSYPNNAPDGDPRRQSLSYPQQQQPGYTVMPPSRSSVVLRSPPAVTHPANGVQRPAPLMGPPSSRPVQGARPAMPPTPTSARLPPTPHGLPFVHRPSLTTTDLRLPPLQTSPGSDGARDIGVQVMSLNFMAKIKLLRTVAAPLSHSRKSIGGGKVHGAIIAIEGEDWSAVDAVSRGLQDLLLRDFDIRVLEGPPEPKPRRDEGGVGFADYMRMISEWHAKKEEMLRFLTGEEEAERLGYRFGETAANGEKEGEAMDVDEESEEARRRQRSLFGSTSSTRSKRIGNDEGVSPKGTASPLHQSSTPKTTKSTGNGRIPLLIIPHYILHTSNVWASALPINDAYSHADHWQWVATLWRGVVGADFTVYVRSSDDTPETAVPPGMGKPAVDIREDLGALIVKGTGKVEEGSVRRVAFEVGEWARVGAMA